MNPQQFSQSPQPFQTVNYIQKPSMIQSYAFNQPNYAIHANEYYPVPNGYQTQQIYQQPQYVHTTPVPPEYQNNPQISYTQEKPNDPQQMQNPQYLKTLSLNPLAQQHLPPKLKMRQPQPTPLRSPTIHQPPQPIQIQQPIHQTQIHQFQMQPQAYIQMQPQIVPHQMHIQPQMIPDYPPQPQPQQYQPPPQVYQPPIQQKSYKPSLYFSDNEPPIAFDIIGRGNLPSVYFTYDNT